MKIQQETIVFPPGQSFKLFRPQLRHYFFWHYHPEFELVYVEALTGIRHVGQHISSFMGSDLILIGPNVPHLNFDYGIKTDYKQIVVQLKTDFMGTAFSETPELVNIQQLFKKACLGLSFHGDIKIAVAEKLRAMQQLAHFEQLIYLLEILQMLAQAEEVVPLNDQDTSVKFLLHDKVRMGTVYKYIHEHYNHSPEVGEIAGLVHLGKASFCRYFKKQTRMTFTDFVNQYRIAQAKTFLLQDTSVSDVCYQVGFESLSYFNKLFKQSTGVNPSVFKRRYGEMLAE